MKLCCGVQAAKQCLRLTIRPGQRSGHRISLAFSFRSVSAPYARWWAKPLERPKRGTFALWGSGYRRAQGSGIGGCPCTMTIDSRDPTLLLRCFHSNLRHFLAQHDIQPHHQEKKPLAISFRGAKAHTLCGHSNCSLEIYQLAMKPQGITMTMMKGRRMEKESELTD